ANKELVIELAKWGNNLNQIAKHLNTNQGAL
ncbi:plasmid mobilization relaxosome protein MobC, partial [Helicobacter pylori]